MRGLDLRPHDRSKRVHRMTKRSSEADLALRSRGTELWLTEGSCCLQWHTGGGFCAENLSILGRHTLVLIVSDSVRHRRVKGLPSGPIAYLLRRGGCANDCVVCSWLKWHLGACFGKLFYRDEFDSPCAEW